jgi:hypothetical protein
MLTGDNSNEESAKSAIAIKEIDSTDFFIFYTL